MTINKATSKAIKLNKANKYYTYQFYGEMLNNNINLKDGLKLAALTSFSWLRNRLSGNIYQELDMLEAKDYKKAKDDSFKSFTINDSYTISVETNIEEGIFALRIIENDTGALSEGVIIPGRTITSDIGFRIVDDKLECGFKTTIHDLNDVEKADNIRFSIVKELTKNQNFGFKQISNIYKPNDMVIEDDNKLLELDKIYKSKDNQLPFIIYCYDDHSEVDITSLEEPSFSLIKDISIPIKSELMKQEDKNEESILSKADAYANRYLGNARCYFLPKKMFNSFKKLYNLKQINIDDVIIIKPNSISFDIYSYNDKNKYQKEVLNYTRDKELNFKDVLFLDDAKVLIDLNNENNRIASERLLYEAREKLDQYLSKQARQIRKDEYVATDNNKDDYLKALEDLEKSRTENAILTRELERVKREIKEKDEYIAYIHRKEKRPNYHNEIDKWVKEYFDFLILDKKAIACLNKNDAENVEIDVVCDALDYLDKVYSRFLFEGLSLDELNEYSSRIYNRPFNVTPSGIPVSARGDCKIKYEFAGKKRSEYPLDQHLKIGSHGELLRIYFIIDYDRKKIVIGSLPNHLEY